MIDHEPTPHIPEDLVEFLDRRFPEQSPRLGTPLEYIWFQAGERNVVRFLKALLARQKENPLHQPTFRIQ